jgi:hypothetical protein
MFKIWIVAVWHQAVTKLKLSNCRGFWSSEVGSSGSSLAVRNALADHHPAWVFITFYSVELTFVAKPRIFAEGAIPAKSAVFTACYSQQDLLTRLYCFACKFTAKRWIFMFFFTQNVIQQGKQLLLHQLFRTDFGKTSKNLLSVNILDLRSSVAPLLPYCKIRGCHWAWA